MRIGVDLLFLLPGAVGGTETHAWHLINELVSHPDLQVVLFTNRSTVIPDTIRGQVEVVRLNLTGENRMIRLLQAQLVLPRVATRSGVALLHSMGGTCPLRALQPVVVTIHDANWSTVDMSPAKRFGLAVMTRLSARAACYVATVSRFSGRELARWVGVPEHKLWLTPNGVGKDILGRCWDERQAEDFLFAVAGVGRSKNIETLVAAFHSIREQFPGLRLVIAGHTNQAVKKLAGQDSSVELRGFVPREELLTLYTRARIFVIPSLYEGFGIPLAEAMAIGVPSVAANAGALPEIAGGAAVLFDGQSREDLGRALTRVLRSAAVRQELSQRGRVQATRFSWEATAEATLSCYRAVLRQGPEHVSN